MNRCMLFLCVLSVFSVSYSQTVLSGTWWINTITPSYLCPTINTFFKINETNHTTHATALSHFNNTPYEFDGNCTAIDSTIVCGKLVTTFNCDKTGIFTNSTGNVTVTWDSYRSLYVNVTIYYNITLGIPATQCVYQGPMQTFGWTQGDWRVVSCDCQSSCCYQVGSTVNIKKIDDYTNKPRFNITGTLTGSYCNNTMSSSDTCYLTSNSLDVEANYTMAPLTCDIMGCRSGVSAPSFTVFSNITTMGLLNWNGCTAKLALKGTDFDRSTNFGGRIGYVLGMILVVALLQFFN